MSALDDLRSLRSGQEVSSDSVFEAIFAAGSTLSDNDRESDVALETAIRLLEAKRNKQLPPDCVRPVELLAEECGLYPYVEPASFDHLTQAVIEAHAVVLEEKVYLHSKQMQVLLWLLDGDNVILSAPTSFGKSLLLDAFLGMRQPNVVVVILPTIALIDECRRRFIRSFGARYRVISTAAGQFAMGEPTIFVLTQERFLQRNDEVDIDLLFVDEFYKLDPDRGDSRFETLNLALYRALPRARQCFMAGPHIRNIELGPHWKGNFRFLRTDYRTVTVNVIDRSNHDEHLQTFLSDLQGVGDEASLVFTASPGSAQTLMSDIMAAGISYASDLGPELGRWIGENYHPEWSVARGNERGIALHHGRLPRSIGQLFVHLFDKGAIKVLICTSTLIEGVNTSAANVFIYDKKINRTDLDFFSFANIRGRVGRMMRHFVGNVFLYHEPPQEIETNVEVPILSDPGAATDYLVMNVQKNELSPHGQERQDRLPLESGLGAEVIRDHGAIGVDLLVRLNERVEQILEADPALLIWNGFPEKEQRVAAAEFALLIAHARKDRTGLHTSKQIAWAWNQLRRIKTLPKFLRWFAGTFHDEDKDLGLDCAFQFLLACEFAFPRTLAAVESLVRQGAPDEKLSYAPFLAAMECWFRPPWMKELDESGVPLPLSERLAPFIGDVSGRVEALAAFQRLVHQDDLRLNEVDKFILRLAFSEI